VQFLRPTREKRETLQVELSILDFDTWRIYPQQGQNRIRWAALTRSRVGEDSKSVRLSARIPCENSRDRGDTNVSPLKPSFRRSKEEVRGKACRVILPICA